MKHPEYKSELNIHGINVLKKINKEIGRINRMKKVSPESILWRNLQIRLSIGLDKREESSDYIRCIESVMGMSDMHSTLLDSERSNEFLIKFFRFVNNPREINR